MKRALAMVGLLALLGVGCGGEDEEAAAEPPVTVEREASEDLEEGGEGQAAAGPADPAAVAPSTTATGTPTPTADPSPDPARSDGPGVFDIEE